MDLECFSIYQDIDSCDGKTQRLLGDSVPKCALECNEKYVKPSVRGIS